MGNDELTVYLDTSAWNALCDWASCRSSKATRGPVYLFSSCALDEFSLAPSSRAQELASYAWRISSRQKLLDHLEMAVAELAAYQRGTDVDYVDHADRGFFLAWRSMRSSGVTVETRTYMSDHMDAAKREYREWFRYGRKLFLPFFEQAASIGLNREWPDLLSELRDGPEMREGLRTSLSDAGLLRALPDPDSLEDVPWSAMPGTSCWLEYHTAMYYLASFKPERLGRPDKGDQVDFRHACYAGVSDIYVTGDARMHEILAAMVPSSRARILLFEQYIDELGRAASNPEIERTASR